MVSIGYESGGPRMVLARKVSVPTENGTSSVQPTVHNFTDCALPVPICLV
jgi:hypothetical protein